jgi:cytidine deaminase
MNERINVLTEAASSVKRKAYSPYSRFSVGAAIRSMEGKIFTGCNVENVSYGLSMCAERIALFKAVSEGYRSFDVLAISSSGVRPALPCGACRQVLTEFNPDLKILLVGQAQFYRLSDLISHPFSRDQMILNDNDRTLLGTRYYDSLCKKTREHIGKIRDFTKVEIFEESELGAYNSDVVIPLIIDKLKELRYISENEKGQISLTTLGQKNCGRELMIDRSI